jgi:hypothetical protein
MQTKTQAQQAAEARINLSKLAAEKGELRTFFAEDTQFLRMGENGGYITGLNSLFIYTSEGYQLTYEHLTDWQIIQLYHYFVGA